VTASCVVDELEATDELLPALGAAAAAAAASAGGVALVVAVDVGHGCRG
jgi:hypothetical protein